MSRSRRGVGKARSKSRCLSGSGTSARKERTSPRPLRARSDRSKIKKQPRSNLRKFLEVGMSLKGEARRLFYREKSLASWRRERRSVSGKQAAVCPPRLWAESRRGSAGDAVSKLEETFVSNHAGNTIKLTLSKL